MNTRLLIVDDDTYIRDLYREIFTAEQFEVTTASDGEEGLKYLLEGGFSAVLLDVMMPKLDGIGVLTKIKDTPPKTPNGPILLLTNLDHDPVLEQAITLGAHSYLLKANMLPPTLVSKVKEAIGSHH